MVSLLLHHDERNQGLELKNCSIKAQLVLGRSHLHVKPVSLCRFISKLYVNIKIGLKYAELHVNSMYVLYFCIS
jgi:hypothetical protein